MSILVTGGAGFIGSHTVEALLTRGEKVIILDDFNDYYSTSYKEQNIKSFKNQSNLTLYRGDIRSIELLNSIFHDEGITKVIHLAARAGVRPSLKKPFLYEEVNYKGLLNILEMCKRYSVKKLIFASSSSVYGNNSKVPFSELDRVDNPISPYAATKKAGELLCYTYHHLYKIPVVCLRFFTVYGPRGRPDMAPFKFTHLISNDKPIEMYGDGNSARDYTYVSEIVDGVISALDINVKYEIINLGNSEPVKLKDLIQHIMDALGKKAKIIRKSVPPGDVQLTYANISKAKNLLGYSPKVSIKEGICRLVNWYNKEFP